MAIQFQPVPAGTMDVKTGQITGLPPAAPIKSPGIPLLDFISQISDLQQKNTPLDKVHAAIDVHPSITDKAHAKQMAQKIYGLSPAPTLEQLL